MHPKIKTINNKKLVGKRLKMSFEKNRTAELWGSFMQRRKEINNQISSDLYSLQLYDSSHFVNFDPTKDFEKWALIEVSEFENIPEGFEAFDLEGGLYAVFLHKG